MFVFFLKRSLVISLASLFISGAGTAHGVEETSPLHVIEVIETEPTPESSSVVPGPESSTVPEPESSTVPGPESSTALQPKSSTIGLVMMGGQVDTNADFARVGGKNDMTGSFFGQLRHERERLSAQVSYYKNLNHRYTGNDLDLIILQPGIKFKPSSAITLIPSVKLDATWLDRTQKPFYRSYGINLLVNFDEGLLSTLNFDVSFRDFKSGKDDYNTNFSGILNWESSLVEGDTLSLRPYVLTNFAYSGSSDIAVRPKYLQGGVNASYTYPVTENISVEPSASVYFRPYKVVKGGVRDDTNTVFGLSVSIDEFMGPNRTLTIGYGHEENHSTVKTDNYINDSFTMEVLWLFF